ncbi:MAG TPA: dimethylsulfonioproprionate lyase family protein [Pseudomonadales bacterium]
MTAHLSRDSDWRDLLDRLVVLLKTPTVRWRDGAPPDGSVEPRSQPVLRHLQTALRLGDPMTASVCALIDRLSPVLQWRRNENYAGADFLDGYAYCELVGPSGHRRQADIALGLLLLGPRVTYPPHAHPAAEIYVVIAGRAQWQQGDGVWRTRAPSATIHHASMEPHAMRTTDEPLLAAYLWQDHLDKPARLLARH